MSEDAPTTYTNRLAQETSPYLRQHAHNPVDWYAWGPEAFARSQAEDKPILLSVGYSACHWCHVMAHESFEDPQIAALMNELFVNVKVDREERPDIDAIYMEAVQALAGNGGWPMTVFLTPDGKPFYGGTYFPPVSRHGLPGFPQLLLAIAEAWRERRHEILAAGDRLADALSRSARIQPAGEPGPQVLEQAVRNLLRNFDRDEGGFGGAPKFPQPMNLEFLLQSHRRNGDPASLEAVMLTLTKMARGGIYDHLGGGFHRYSTDDHWLVPHFEKMLYDNAQLVRVYLHAWRTTGDDAYRLVVEETLDYLLREMTAPEGGFYSTQDADSEGEEGKFFLWTPDEVRAVLGPDDARLFSTYYGVTEHGNFREGGPGANILNVARAPEAIANATGVTAEQLAEFLARARAAMLAARERRIHPGRDDKVLAEWNGLMIEALAEAGAALGRADYTQAAERAAGFILEHMRAPGDGLRLHRSFRDGQARFNAYLEDYAAVGLGLVALYQATFAPHWLEAAAQTAESILALFHDADGTAFFQTSADHERLITRRKDFIDSAVPSGNALTAELMLRLATLLGRPEYIAYAMEPMRLMADALGAQPGAFGRLLSALDRMLYPGVEVAIVGEPPHDGTQALLAEVWGRYLPAGVMALLRPGDEDAPRLIPLLQHRTPLGDKPTAYVCRNFACNLPVTEAKALGEQLDAAL
jgi:uncharacterized protein YyaL (SSP411 family)